MDIKEMSSWGLSKAIYDVIENGFYADEETGEVFFTDENLNELSEALDNKLNGICGFIKMTDAKIENLKRRKSEIDESIKYYENRNDRLSEFLKTFMIANNIEKKELADYRLSTRNSSSVSILDEEAVYKYLEKDPELKKVCQKVETKVSLSKQELKKAMQNNISIPGCSIVENKNIIIK